MLTSHSFLTIKTAILLTLSTILMFGILAIGDRQYKIVVGEACVFETIDKQEGENITMSGLLLLSNDGEVLSKKEELLNYQVNGTIVKQFRENKVIAYKKKRRQGYEKKRGHRQYKTLVLINSIELKA